MALRNASNAVLKDEAPLFESAPIDQPHAGTVQQPSNLASGALTTLAPPQTQPLQVVQPHAGFHYALESFKNQFDAPGTDYGTFPRIIATQGILKTDDDTMDKLGTEAVIKVLAWNLRYMAGNGVKDDEAKSDDLRVSFDNKTIQGSGEDLHAYIAGLKAQGFANARVKTYGDLWGLLISTSKGVLPQPKLVSFSLSPQSMKMFNRFKAEQGIAECGGAPPVTHLKIQAQPKSLVVKGAAVDFSQMTFQAVTVA